MNETKPWYQSLTFRGLIVTLLGAILHLLNYFHISIPFLTDANLDQIVAFALETAGLIVAAWGRKTATKAIE